MRKGCAVVKERELAIVKVPDRLLQMEAFPG